MKISDEEVEAAAWAWDSTWDSTLTPRGIECMRLAITAAYAVRKARKAAKRAKARPDQQAATSKPKQPEHRFKVGDRVVHPVNGAGDIEWISDEENDPYPCLVQFESGRRIWPHIFDLTPEPAAPVWNGKFEVGKSYRTRDGRKVIISDVINSLPYPLRGELSGYFDSWTVTGCNVADKQNSGDLVGQWED